MSKVVFILGAGASAKAGAPLMWNFLDVAKDLYTQGRCGDREGDFRLVFKAISQLQNVHSKARLNIENLESVFGAFEMARILERLGDFSKPEIEHLPSAMRHLIVRTLDQTVKFPISGEKVLPAEPYSVFAKLISAYRMVHAASAVKGTSAVSVITFNYDIAVDYALTFHRVPTDYGFSEPAHGDVGAVPLLKLHGSLNWVTCSGECKKVIHVPIEKYFPRELFGDDYFYTDIGSSLRNEQHCGVQTNGESVLVPPTWSKGEHHRAISSVWSRAAKELSEAESIFVIGFSLPASDSFFQYLYALGSVGEPLRRFYVFDQAPKKGEVHLRYQNLLGPGAEQRFDYFPMYFEEDGTILRMAEFLSIPVS